MENRKIKKYFNKLSCDTKKILVAILEDSLVYLDNQKLINNQILNRVVSIYFLLIDYDYKNMVEFDDLNIKEKKLIYKIVLDGVASMYVDNEYLQFSDVGTKYKKKDNTGGDCCIRMTCSILFYIRGQYTILLAQRFQGLLIISKDLESSDDLVEKCRKVA